MEKYTSEVSVFVPNSTSEASLIFLKINERRKLMSIISKIDERSEWPSAVCTPKDLIWLDTTGMTKYTSKASVFVPNSTKRSEPNFSKLNERSRLISIYTNSGRVDTIQSALGFLEAKKTSKKMIFLWWKQACRKISCDVVHFSIALVIIEISFDLTLSVVSESIETHTLTDNRKLFN